jgi:hypothetical protein
MPKMLYVFCELKRMYKPSAQGFASMLPLLFMCVYGIVILLAIHLIFSRFSFCRHSFENWSYLCQPNLTIPPLNPSNTP